MATAELHPQIGPGKGEAPGGESVLDKASMELSARRTGMSFQRTRMSADRTLMSVIRTSLSLISFGFTIAQGFQKLHENGVVKSAAAPTRAACGDAMSGSSMRAGWSPGSPSNSPPTSSAPRSPPTGRTWPDSR